MKPYFAWLVILGFSSALLGSFYVIHNATFGTPLDIILATTATESMVAAAAAAQFTVGTDAGRAQGYREYVNGDYHFSIYYPGDYLLKNGTIAPSR